MKYRVGAAVAAIALIMGCATMTDPDSQGAFPVYGNWCGPGHPKEGTTPDPINSTDAACRTHAVCYARHGYLNSLCDKNLISALNGIQTTDPVEEIARQGIIAYFENSPKL